MYERTNSFLLHACTNPLLLQRCRQSDQSGMDGKSSNRKMNKHKSGMESTFLKTWIVCNGTKHRKHMVMAMACLSDAHRYSCLEKVLLLQAQSTLMIQSLQWFEMAVTLLKAHKVLISLLKQRSYRTNRRTEGVLEGITAMHINERLLLDSSSGVKHITSGSAKDPWNALMAVDRRENKHNCEAEKDLWSCFCNIGYAVARDLGYQRNLRRQNFATSIASGPREASSSQYVHCLSLFLPLTTFLASSYGPKDHLAISVNGGLKGNVVNWLRKRSS